jgi:hypothetical protein
LANFDGSSSLATSAAMKLPRLKSCAEATVNHKAMICLAFMAQTRSRACGARGTDGKVSFVIEAGPAAQSPDSLLVANKLPREALPTGSNIWR